MCLSLLLLGLSYEAGDLTIDTGHRISLGLSRVMGNNPASTHFISSVINKYPPEGRINPSLPATQSHLFSVYPGTSLTVSHLILVLLLVY